LELFTQVAEQAHQQAQADPKNANAWYWHAYALGRYSQGISVAKALAQGLGSKIRESLEKAIALAPAHADAHIALGAFHAEVIDKVGALIGGMTYGAKKDKGLKLFQEALRLNPESAIAMIEYANALVMLEGERKMHEATALYEKAAACKPQDAMEQLDVDLAQAELEEGTTPARLRRSEHAPDAQALRSRPSLRRQAWSCGPQPLLLLHRFAAGR
jgi:tetratricopeptide (TPR) repeat protein